MGPLELNPDLTRHFELLIARAKADQERALLAYRTAARAEEEAYHLQAQYRRAARTHSVVDECAKVPDVGYAIDPRSGR